MRGSVVLVPFPYTDRPVRYRRPALVVAGPLGDENHPLLWVLMITSATNRKWPGDVAVGDGYGEARLLADSIVRTAKIANVELQSAKHIGTIPAECLVKVSEITGRHLVIDPLP